MKNNKNKKTIEIDVKRALEHLKDVALGLSPDISCLSCNEAYCCRKQKIIEISSREFAIRKPLITKEHKERAKIQKDIFEKTGLYTCPFNNPIDGKCEIYDTRFAVCASYCVMNNKEDCNSDTKSGLEVVNPMIIFSKITEENTMNYLTHVSEGIDEKGDNVQSDILQEFIKLMS